MGKSKKTRKFAAVKRMKKPADGSSKNGNKLIPLKTKSLTPSQQAQSAARGGSSHSLSLAAVRHIPKFNSSLFFKFNTALGPPYQILVDTNFINFSIQNKLELFKSMMDCLLAKCTPIVTDCVMAELEKLGSKFALALKIAKDPRIDRIRCSHSGTYADDCLVSLVSSHKCYIVATCDRDLKRRIRKIPGVPIMFITAHKYSIERFPDVNNAPRQG